ncbi:PREDICTED: probable cytochrome P450 304a1 [Habropoda laboriosa]|uniref:probable cytochrome P450 304a1 n=1 Tax=Habropoda laboriosa TaxID=597456 RepID=UPI00083D54E9|nr:PREDICTED: probable cytochrome P450 304a1 [Habropoda laboriosa]
MSPFLIVILLCIIAYKFYDFLTCVPPNSPPCIPRLPIVGSYWHLLWHDYKYPYNAVQYYVNKLQSKVVTCYFGSFMAIIANDYKNIREVLSREDFDGRPTEIDVFQARSFGKKLGIFFNEGSFWQEQRRFTLRHMRDFGFGRRHEKYETDMMEEVSILIKMLKEGPINDKEKTFLKNGSALFPDILYPYAANSIWDIVFGEIFDRSEHDKLRYFCESAMSFQRAADTTGGAIVSLWYLKYFGNMFGYQDIVKSNYRMVDFIKERVENRKYLDNEDRGLIDRYLKQIQEKSNVKSTFSDEQLLITLVDFMFPALSAMPSALVHAMKLVMHNPEVLKNIQEEIDRVVGSGRLVTWEDRTSLPYTEATIREALRFETITPFGVFHKTLNDTTLSGFDIPKNTLIVTNLTALNTDPEFWGDPENFRPERFLKEDGQLGKDFTFVFGLGHRVCAGETFARYNMFGVFAALMQNFNFSFVKGEPTSLQDKLPGLITTPKETWIKVEQRT